jgi:hypothetical protein
MYVYIYIYTYICMYMYTCRYITSGPWSFSLVATSIEESSRPISLWLTALYIGIYTYIYMYVYIHTNMYMYMCIHTHICIYIYMHVYVSICILYNAICVHLHVYVNLCMSIRLYSDDEGKEWEDLQMGVEWSDKWWKSEEITTLTFNLSYISLVFPILSLKLLNTSWACFKLLGAVLLSALNSQDIIRNSKDIIVLKKIKNNWWIIRKSTCLEES